MGTCTLDLKSLWQQNPTGDFQQLKNKYNYVYENSTMFSLDSAQSVSQLFDLLYSPTQNSTPEISLILVDDGSSIILTYTNVFLNSLLYPSGQYREDVGKYDVCFVDRENYTYLATPPYEATKEGLPFPIVAHAFRPVVKPKEIGIFSATDAVFGNVRAGVTHTKHVKIENKSTTRLRVTDIQPRDLGNFKVGSFTYGSTIFNVSPYNLPITLEPNSFREFSVDYTPVSASTDRAEMTYFVETEIDKTVVTEEKLFTILEGSAYTLGVNCSDFDFGRVDVSRKTVTGSVTIENKSNVDVIVTDYFLTDSSVSGFEITTNVKENVIPAGETITVGVQYTTNPFTIEKEQKQTINFRISYDNQPVLTDKLFSVLTVFPYADEIDDVIDDVTDVVTDDDNGTYVNKKFSNVLDKSVQVMKKRTFPLWDCVGEKLHQYFTGSNGTQRDKYFLPIYSGLVNTEEGKHQFDISYGNANGSGSSLVIGNNNMMPSKVMYRKYLVETHGTTTGNGQVPERFTFRNGVTSDSVYFIQVDRNHFKDMIDPGNFELCLAPLSSSSNQLVNTGSNFYVNQSSSFVFTLIDDSGDFKQDRTDRSGLKEYYNLVSGSRRDGEYGEPTDNSWGLFYPKMGLFVLDANVLDMSCSFNTVTASIDGDNIRKLFLSISGSGSPTDFRPTSESFFARSAETAIVQTYFARVTPREFLYSNNPTYVKGNTNQLKYDAFIRNPVTYITTIGLYSKKGELVAVGKLKKPIRKTETDSYVFQVRVRIM